MGFVLVTSQFGFGKESLFFKGTEVTTQVDEVEKFLVQKSFKIDRDITLQDSPFTFTVKAAAIRVLDALKNMGYKVVSSSANEFCFVWTLEKP